MPMYAEVKKWRAPVSNLTKSLLLILGIFVVCLIAHATFVADTRLLILLLVALGTYCFSVLSFLRMEFSLDSGGVKARMFPFRYFIPYNQIRHVEVVSEPFKDFWMGLGLRMWKDRLASRSRFGRSVVIYKTEGKFRKILLSVPNPDEFISELKLRMKRS